MAKVPIQKGPINPNPPTMKGTPRSVKDMQDYKERNMRFDGQTLKLKEPKK